MIKRADRKIERARYLAHTNPSLLTSQGIECPYKITRICNVNGCGRKHTSGGMCDRHYRLKRYKKKIWPVKVPKIKNIREKKDPIYLRFRLAVSEAKRRANKPFTLTFEEFKVLAEKDCFYCGGYFGKVKFGKGLDRIDNSKGYEAGNVIPACEQCNGTRSNRWNVEETKIMITAIILSKRKPIEIGIVA